MSRFCTEPIIIAKEQSVEFLNSLLMPDEKYLRYREDIVKRELCKYNIFYRVVLSRVVTHKIEKNIVRKFKEKHGTNFMYASKVLEEQL